MKNKLTLGGVVLALWAIAPPLAARIVWLRPVEPWSFLRSKSFSPETSPPVIREGRVYLVSSRGRYVVLNAKSGRKILAKNLKYRAAGGLLVDQDRVVFGAQSGDLVCLAADTGQLLWTHPLKMLDISPPVASGGRIIFQTGIDAVTALDRETGELAWTYQHRRNEDMGIKGMSAPLADGSTIFIGATDGVLLALRAADGALLWKKPLFAQGTFRDIDGALAQDEFSVFAADFYGEVAAVSKRSGMKYWDYTAGGLAGPVLDGELVYVAGRDGRVAALDKDSGLVIWETKLERPQKHSPEKFLLTPARYKHWLAVPNASGRIYLLNPENGKLERTIRRNRPISVAPSATEEGLFLWSNKGILYQLRYN